MLVKLIGIQPTSRILSSYGTGMLVGSPHRIIQSSSWFRMGISGKARFPGVVVGAAVGEAVGAAVITGATSSASFQGRSLARRRRHPAHAQGEAAGVLPLLHRPLQPVLRLHGPDPARLRVLRRPARLGGHPQIHGHRVRDADGRLDGRGRHLRVGGKRLIYDH